MHDRSFAVGVIGISIQLAGIGLRLLGAIPKDSWVDGHISGIGLGLLIGCVATRAIHRAQTKLKPKEPTK